MAAVRLVVERVVRTAAAAVVVTLALAATSCTAPLRGPDGPGKLSFALPRAVGVYAGVESWRLVGDGPSGEAQLDQYLETVDTDVTLEGLELGTWTFTLEGLDPDGTALYRAQGEVLVGEGDNSLELTLTALYTPPEAVEPLAVWDFSTVGVHIFGDGTLLPATGTVGGDLRVNGTEMIETVTDPTFGTVLKISSSYCTYQAPAGLASLDGRSGDWTIMAWVRPDNITAGETLFGGPVARNEEGLMVSDASSANGFNAGLIAGSTEYEYQSAPAPSGAWQHLAWVKTDSGVRLYLNGIDAGLAEGAAQSLALPFAVVGATNGGSNLPFRGQLASIRVYGAALATSQVIADAGLSPGMFAGGAGTPASPYLVTTAGQLDNVRHVRNARFKQTTSISLSGTWIPIGSEQAPFRGFYDGNYATISGMSTTGTGPIGLFGVLDGASVAQLTLSGTISSSSSNCEAGLVVGRALNSDLMALAVSGVVSVTGSSSIAGGLAGTVGACNLGLCHVDVTVSGSADSAGGLTGMTTGNAAVVQTTVSGSVSGNSNVGGLVGLADLEQGAVAIQASGTNVNITTALNGGGLIGAAQKNSASGASLSVADSYARAVLAAPTNLSNGYLGGLVGRIDQADASLAAQFADCYAVASAMSLPSSVRFGGAIGMFAGVAGSSCQFARVLALPEASGGLAPKAFVCEVTTQAVAATDCVADTGSLTDVTSGVNLRSGAALHTQATFAGLSWDFAGETANGTADTWLILEGASLPYLSWEPEPSLFAVGSVGPAGGIIFYDKGDWAGGWRYMEVAPADLKVGSNPYVQFGDSTNGQDVTSTQVTVGSGPANTAALVAVKASDVNTAAMLADGYTLHGYSDWFLPSRDELVWLYTNWAALSPANLLAEPYWSSTDTADDDKAVTVLLNNGSFVDRYHSDGVRARPVRRF